MEIPTFWGLAVEPKKKYKQNVDIPFTITSIALGLEAKGGNTSLIIEVDGSEPHVVCTLNHEKWPQHSCDIRISEGQDISIYSQGASTLHLTGYQEILLEDEDDDEFGDEYGSDMEDMDEDAGSDDFEDMDSEGDDDDDDEDDDEGDEGAEPKFVEIEDETPQPAAGKRKAEASESSAKKAKSEQKPVEHKPEKPKKPETPAQPAKKEKEAPKSESKPAEPKKQQKAGKQMKLEGGTIAEDVVVGSGAAAKPGKHVGVYYVGRTAHNNKIFDACQSGKPFKFNLGRGEVIKGWDIGVAGMQVGGKRVLRIPPNQAYGARGHPPVIPGNATLIFEVELKYVK